VPARVALYVRVSTTDQTVKNQEIALRKFCEAKGYQVVAVFGDDETDHAASESSRPGFSDMMKAAHRRDFDQVIVWSLDRLTRRGIYPLFNIFRQLKAFGVGWESLQEPWATNSGPVGEVLLAIIAWVGEQERKKISERVKAAHARKKAGADQQGAKVRWGRPKGVKDSRPRSRRYRKKPQ